MLRTLEQWHNYNGDTIHDEKDQKPTNEKPNVNGMDFQIILKKFNKQLNGRLQFMKTIEGTHLDIHTQSCY